MSTEPAPRLRGAAVVGSLSGMGGASILEDRRLRVFLSVLGLGIAIGGYWWLDERAFEVAVECYRLGFRGVVNPRTCSVDRTLAFVAAAVGLVILAFALFVMGPRRTRRNEKGARYA